MSFEAEQQDGEFIRQEDRFRDWVRADGSSPSPAEAGRYHLYVSLACPWAHRIIITRRLKHLEEAISMTVVDPIRDDRGWIRTEILRGSKVIEEEINGLRYNIGAGDFFQVNPGIAGLLQKDLVEASKPFAGFPMVDLYCGVGFFSLALARTHGSVIGVEFLAGAVERARENASLNGLKARFFVDDVLDDLAAEPLDRLEAVADLPLGYGELSH